MRAVLFARSAGLEECLVLAEIHIGNVVLGLEGLECVARIEGELLAVCKARAALVTHKVDEHLVMTDVLCPSTIEGDRGARSADEARDHIVNVVGSLGIHSVLRPHALVGIGLDVLRHFVVSVAGEGLELGRAEDVEDEIEEVNAPVDENAAARFSLGGECAAESGDGAVGAEGAVNVIEVTELAALVHLSEHFDRLVIAVADADIEDLAACVSLVSHLLRESVVDGYGLLAEDVLICAESIHCDRVVSEVGSENEDSLDLGVCEGYLVVGDGVLDHFVLVLHCLRLFDDEVAGILDAKSLNLRERGEVSILGNSAAADNSNNHDVWLLSEYKLY